MRLPRVSGALVALFVMALSGCQAASPAPTPSATGSAASDQQREALADGKVTWDEYKAGFDAYRGCLEKAGYELVSPHVDEFRLMDFGVPDAAVQSGVDDKCYRLHYSGVDDAWQIAHLDESETAQTVKSCLSAAGISPKKRYSDNLDLLEEHGIDVEKCSAEG